MDCPYQVLMRLEMRSGFLLNRLILFLHTIYGELLCTTCVITPYICFVNIIDTAHQLWRQRPAQAPTCPRSPATFPYCTLVPLSSRWRILHSVLYQQPKSQVSLQFHEQDNRQTSSASMTGKSFPDYINSTVVTMNRLKKLKTGNYSHSTIASTGQLS